MISDNSLNHFWVGEPEYPADLEGYFYIHAPFQNMTKSVLLAWSIIPPLKNTNKLEWAELNQAETVRLPVNAKLRFQV